MARPTMEELRREAGRTSSSGGMAPQVEHFVASMAAKDAERTSTARQDWIGVELPSTGAERIVFEWDPDRGEWNQVPTVKPNELVRLGTWKAVEAWLDERGYQAVPKAENVTGTALASTEETP